MMLEMQKLVKVLNAEAGYAKYTLHKEPNYLVLVSETGTGTQFNTDEEMLAYLRTKAEVALNWIEVDGDVA
jgi:hypothetical protein